MRVFVAKGLPVLVSMLVMATMPAPVKGQGGPGGGGGGGGAGIPLGGGGKSQDDGAEKPDKKSASERPLSGIVTDADGNPITGAVVQLKDTRTLKVRSDITHEKGEFTFTGLNKQVDYEVSAMFKGHVAAPHTLSNFDTRARPVVNLQIK